MDRTYEWRTIGFIPVQSGWRWRTGTAMAASTYDAVAGWLTQEQLEAIEGGDHGRCLQYRTPRFASGPTRRVVAAFIQDCEVWLVDGVPNVEGVLLAGEEAE